MKVNHIHFFFTATLLFDAIAATKSAKIRLPANTEKQAEEKNGAGITTEEDLSLVWGRTLSEPEKGKRRLKGSKSNSPSESCAVRCDNDYDCDGKCSRCKRSKSKKQGKCTDKEEKGKDELFAKDKEEANSYSY